MDGRLPTPGWSNGLLALDAANGAFKGFYQVPRESNYRDSDIDIDVGASPTLFDLGTRRVVGVGCKNGSFHVLDADTLAPIKWRQLLPTYNDGPRSRPSIRIRARPNRCVSGPAYRQPALRYP